MKCYGGRAGLEGKRPRGRKRIMMLDEFTKGSIFEIAKRRT